MELERKNNGRKINRERKKQSKLVGGRVGG
jgi:hypothetical protein